MLMVSGVFGGVDTHADVHVAAALDTNGGLLGIESFPTDAAGYRSLADWLAGFDVLATVFRTVEGDPASLDPTDVTFDVSPWDGQTIRLRFAEVDNQGPFFVGVDDVRRTKQLGARAAHVGTYGRSCCRIWAS